MRQEVDLLTSTLIGLIAKCIGLENPGFFQIPTEFGYWRVEITKNDIQFKCWINLCHPGDKLGYDSNGNIPFYMEAVERVHKTLPVLIGGLFDSVEGLKESCIPLISASRVFEGE